MKKVVVLLGAVLASTGCGNGRPGNLTSMQPGQLQSGPGQHQIGGAFDSKCLLKTPIDLKGADPFENEVVLTDVKLNKVPRFTDEEAYDPDSDKFEVTLFNIQYYGKTGNLGASIGIQDKLEHVGFSVEYIGNFGFNGGKYEKNGQVAYRTRLVRRYVEPPHAVGDAVYEVWVLIWDGAIHGLQLIAPVYRIVGQTEGSNWVAFSGDHQKICLTAAASSEK